LIGESARVVADEGVEIALGGRFAASVEAFERIGELDENARAAKFMDARKGFEMIQIDAVRFNESLGRFDEIGLLDAAARRREERQ
jgi:hypothetical protein